MTVLAALTLLSINLYISLKDERQANNEQRVVKLVCDDLEIELEIGSHYRVSWRVPIQTLKGLSAPGTS